MRNSTIIIATRRLEKQTDGDEVIAVYREATDVVSKFSDNARSSIWDDFSSGSFLGASTIAPFDLVWKTVIIFAIYY